MGDSDSQKGFLIDNTKCIGCRGCQSACKQWNDLPAEKTSFFGGPGYQNPSHLSSSTYTLVKYNEVEKDGKLADWAFAKQQCQHCLEPACVSACLVGALVKTDDGPVVWDEGKCIGCRYCMLACPFDIPKFEWSKAIPDIRKCTLCADRIAQGLQPACSKACPTGAVLYGQRGELIEVAMKRLKDDPGKYHQHIYGKDEVGGTCVMYISKVPLEGFAYPKNLPKVSAGSLTAPAMHAIPGVVIGLGTALGLVALVVNRKKKLAESNTGRKEAARNE